MDHNRPTIARESSRELAMVHNHAPSSLWQFCTRCMGHLYSLQGMSSLRSLIRFTPCLARLFLEHSVEAGHVTIAIVNS